MPKLLPAIPPATQIETMPAAATAMLVGRSVSLPAQKAAMQAKATRVWPLPLVTAATPPAMAITPSATGRPRARYRGRTSTAIHASRARPTAEKQAICTACCAAECGGLIRARMPITANAVTRISQ